MDQLIVVVFLLLVELVVDVLLINFKERYLVIRLVHLGLAGVIFRIISVGLSTQDSIFLLFFSF
jgi:hypothetical protein